MMKWEAPVVKELNVQETAGGQSNMPIDNVYLMKSSDLCG